MKIQFEKYNGLGNDFVFIDGMKTEIDLSCEQVARICDRHFGIGADGVIVVKKADGADGYMHYINSDGSLAQMCGNGVRCFAKYLVDHRVVDPAEGSLVAMTLAGPRSVEFQTDDDDWLTLATVEMGRPVLSPAQVPCLLPSVPCGEHDAVALSVPIDSPWGPFAFTAVSMGNPHAVCFVDDWGALDDRLFSDSRAKSLDTLRIDELGAWYESHSMFPEKTNVEFAEVADGEIKMRVYERGCGETLACGTGACATAVAGFLTGRTGRDSVVSLRGGDLRIAWGQDGIVRMMGPAEFSFSGLIEL